jgi:hypothetical protein
MALPWILQQLGGQKKRIVLSGWSAPMGRRRESAMVNEKINVRTKTSLYPDSKSARKTRHVFGIEHEPWELKGRFMDRELGIGGSNAAAAELKEFLRDALPIRVSWGNIVSYDAFLDSVELGREAATDIAYTLHIDVDEDNNAGRSARSVEAPPSPAAVMARVMAQVDASVAPLIRPQKPAIPISLFDKISDAISVVTGAMGAVAGVANDIDDFVSATGAQLDRLVYGIRQGRTAIQTLRGVYTRAQLSTFSTASAATDLLETEAAQVQFEANMLAVLAQLEELDRQAAISKRGKLATHVTARDGDTWESLAFAAYGDPDRTDALRDANGVRFGELPVAGRTYMVPQS